MGVSIAPQILMCDVMHKRLHPRENGFVYPMFYLSIPLDQVEALRSRVFGVETPNLFSFYQRDHGARDGTDSREWLTEQLETFELGHLAPGTFEGSWRLITLPRMLGYVFNPVSFWLAETPEGELQAVLAEVNNTFGETHAYLLVHPDGRMIDSQEWIESDKQFHVSPFLKVEGSYRFRFNVAGDHFAVWIDYYDAAGQKTLMTSMVGRAQPYKTVTLLKACGHIPFVTFRVITLIHYQALKLWLKRIRYLCKPEHPGRFITKWPSR